VDSCRRCRFVYGDWAVEALPPVLGSLGARYAEPLLAAGKAPGLIRTRPAPDVWSGLEYACHFRDVLLAQRERLYLALVEDGPSFAPMYRERRVELGHYNAQSPVAVSAQIKMAAELLGSDLAGLAPDQWQRSCVYNYVNPSRRTLLWLAQHTLHEGEHHLLDIKTVLASAASS
jgi:DinB superfamily